MSTYDSQWRRVENLFPVSENFPEDFLTEEQVKIENGDSRIPDTVSALDALQSQDYPSFPQIDHSHHGYPEPLTPDSPSFQHQGLNCLMTSLPPSHVISPSSDEISGEYNFFLALETQPKKVANPDWIYSPAQNKLYIKSQTPCPMKFSVTGSPPPHTYVRAMPMFKLPEHAKDVVRCCPNHTQQDQGNREAPGHFIRSDNPHAEYQQCSQSGRMSVKIPFNTNVGASIHDEVTVHELFSFICNNSCGGLNRRAILVVFTLETGESQELLGRCAIEVRVCACPGRDSKQDNEAVSKPSRKKRKMATDGVSSSTSVTLFPTSELSPSQPLRSPIEDNTVYNLKVCGYVNYRILRKIAFALEFFANMKSRFSNMPSDDPEFPDLFAEGMISSEQQECDSCDSSGPIPRPIPQASPIMNGQQSLPSCAVSHSSGDLDSSWYQSSPQDTASSSQSTSYMGCYTTYRRLTMSMVYCGKDE